MGLALGFRFWVQVQCFRPCDGDQYALTQVYHPCQLTNSLGSPNGKYLQQCFCLWWQNKHCLIKFWKFQTVVSILLHEVVPILSYEGILPHETKWNTWFYMAGSRLDRTDDFQKFWGSGLDSIQLLGIRIGLGLKHFTVHSSLMDRIGKPVGYCCDRKSWAACTQIFVPSQQATIEFTYHDHSIISCSCHIYVWFHAHPVPYESHI